MRSCLITFSLGFPVYQYTATLRPYHQTSYETLTPTRRFPQGVSPAASESLTAIMARIDARFPGRVHRMKVVDPSLPANDPFEGIVGISQWRIHTHDRSPEELAAEKKWAEADEAEHGVPEGQNTKMMEAFVAVHGALKEKYLGGRAHVYLHVLMTRPGFQRKGVGAMSMQWGVDQAQNRPK